MIKGILTHQNTGIDEEVELEYEIVLGDENRRIFHLINGVTGYESFYLDPRDKMGFNETKHYKNFMSNLKTHGWLACAGMGDWDRLFIPGEEMAKVLLS